MERYGLEAFKTSKNPAILLLYNKYKENFNESVISFQIAPRINASGRLGKEDVAMKFLLSETYEAAEKYFIELDNINNDRKILSDDIFESAIEKIKKDNLDKNSIIILYDKHWHTGVTGIVASKIAELFKKPAIIFSIEDDIAKGSGRTIPGVNIFELLGKANGILLEYGGHEKAAGLSLKADKLNEFKEILEKELDVRKIQIIEEYDYEFKFEEISYDTLKEIEELAPFGEKNLKPNFLFKKVEVTSVDTYGNMLKLGLKQNNIYFIGIGFGLAYKQENPRTKLNKGDEIYLLGILEENVYMGRSSIQINMKEINLINNKI